MVIIGAVTAVGTALDTTFTSASIALGWSASLTPVRRSAACSGERVGVSIFSDIVRRDYGPRRLPLYVHIGSTATHGLSADYS